MKMLAGHNLPQLGILLFGHGLIGREFARAVVSGATQNPTYGQTAQHAVQLTASAQNLPDGVTVTGYQWRTVASATTLSAVATFTPDAATHDLAQLYCVLTRSDASTLDTPAYVVRDAPPVAGSLAAFSALQGAGPFQIDVASGFTGLRLTYTESVGWAAISGSVLTIDDAVRTTTIQILATNSGGTASVDQFVDIERNPPVLSFITWDDPTDSATLTSNEAGTLIWATYDVLNPVTPDGSGGWTGPIIESGSFIVTAPGPTEYSGPYTTVSNPANRLRYYIRDSDGHDSDPITETFTSNFL